MRNVRLPLTLALAALSLAACNRKQQAAPAPEPVASTPAPAPAPTTGADDAAERERMERERLAREAAERVRAALEATVYFAFDQSDLDASAREQLGAKLPHLQADGAIRLRITGHADERGSDEYNMALGLRRAAAARRFLVQRGIAEGRIEIETAGEEQPVCSESEESCWRQNRRAMFAVTAGAPVASRR